MADRSRPPDPGTDEANAARLLLIDAGSLIYPAYFAMSGLSTAEGFPTGAIYGVSRMLLKLLGDYPAQYAAVAFDSRGPTWRHQLYAEYKAQRPPMAEELAVQLPRIQEVVEALGLPHFAAPGYEADDLIATLIRRLVRADRDLPALIFSGDKDLMQLVGERVQLLRPAGRAGQALELLDAEGVRRHLGVPPEQIGDYLALVGDAVDNVPGVPGIGKVTAKRLLGEFGSLEGLLAQAERVSNRRARDALLNYAEQARLSRQLVELQAVPLEQDSAVLLAKCRCHAPDRARLRELFQQLQFRSLLQELALDPLRPAEIAVEIVLSEEQFEVLLARLGQAPAISLDLETSSRDALRAQIVGISLAVETGRGYYLPLAHDYLGAPPQLGLEETLTRLRPLLENPGKELLGQNIKYDLKILRRYGIKLRQVAFDSMIAAYLLEPGSPKSLAAIAARYLHRAMQPYKELSQQEFSKVPIDEAARYSVADAETVLCLRRPLSEKLRADRLWELFSEIELPLIPVLTRMELSGIGLDPAILKEQARELHKQIEVLRAEMARLAGGEFNPSSPKQVAEVLFERLRLKPIKPIKKTKSGVSTNAQVLRELADLHPLPELILQYRELEKLRGTYVEKLPSYINPETGRIHTTFNQSVTTTGRLSSSDPNLQNIPVRTALGGQIRSAFIAPAGRLLLGADYSQIELRVLAHLSGDPELLRAFRAGEDLHRKTAAELFGLAPEQVNAYQRGIAKRINFGIIYGISAYRLARELQISQKEAQSYIDSYYRRYERVKAYATEQVQLAEAQGYVSTITGRRRYLPEIKSHNWARRSYEQRNAVNAPVQGSAADIMKLAMLRVAEALRQSGLRCDMLLQIHDELLFEVDQAEAPAAAGLIKRAMEQVMKLEVPLKVEVKAGQSWGGL